MKKIYIFIGPPAGGKTSIANRLAEKLGNAKVVEVDEIKKKISGSVFGKNDEERELWFMEINKQIKSGLESCDNVVVDEGFFENKYLYKILEGVGDIERYIVEINFVFEEHLKRSKRRKDKNQMAIRRMYEIYNNVKGEDKIIPNISINNQKMTIDEIVNKIIQIN